MERPEIVVENLSANYPGHQALKDITVNIPGKRITALIGPSGCGKTTLLKSLNRLIELDDGAQVTGRVIVNGVNVFDDDVDVNEIRKKMGLISQTPSPLPMSIYDNIAYGPRIHGLKDSKQLDLTVEQSLRAVGLWDEVRQRLREPATKLSVGQQQRLCIARALAIKPEVLLCDEPTSALDPISARNVEEQLLALKRDYTIIFVTHVLRQAKRIADYVVFLYFGEIVEHGPAEQFFSSPHYPRTKAYIEGAFG